MRKRSKFLLGVSIVELLLFIFSFIMYLLDTSSTKYLTTFIITGVLFAFVLMCTICVFIMEKRSLIDFTNDKYSFKLVNRDHVHILRNLLDKKEVENSSFEAELLKKYEEMAVDFERKNNCYLVFLGEEVISIIEAKRDFKEKTISFNDLYVNTNEIEILHEAIAINDKKTIK